MSEAARDFLGGIGISFEYEELLPMVLNRDSSDVCPMEKRAMDIDDPARAFEVFDEVIP